MFVFQGSNNENLVSYHRLQLTNQSEDDLPFLLFLYIQIRV